MTVSPPTTPSSKREVLLMPNLALIPPRTDSMTAASKAKPKDDDLPLPPPPAEEAPPLTATTILLGTGYSAMSLLGSAVMGIGSVAASALGTSSESDTATAKHPDSIVDERNAKEQPPETMLGAISNAVLTRAASLRDAAFGTSVSIPDLAGQPRSPDTDLTKDLEGKQPRRANTAPVQYSADGTPFSSDPSISAMQRIPDHPCGHVHNHRTPIAHCCSAPDILTAVEEECNCNCSALPHKEEKDENAAPDGHGPPKKHADCQCVCHARNKRQSGHFHRVQQVVKGTKRVVRDIKNVL